MICETKDNFSYREHLWLKSGVPASEGVTSLSWHKKMGESQFGKRSGRETTSSPAGSASDLRTGMNPQIATLQNTVVRGCCAWKCFKKSKAVNCCGCLLFWSWCSDGYTWGRTLNINEGLVHQWGGFGGKVFKRCCGVMAVKETDTKQTRSAKPTFSLAISTSPFCGGGELLFSPLSWGRWLCNRYPLTRVRIKVSIKRKVFPFTVTI